MRRTATDNDAAYVAALASASASASRFDIAGAIVRVWAVNKNNCLLLHFVVIFGCVCVWECVCVRECVCEARKSVYTSIMRARGLKLTHALE